MLRTLRIIGAAYLALTIVAIVVRRAMGPSDVKPPTSVASMSDAARWFELVRGSCSAQEIDRRLAANPAPQGDAGAAFSAGCFALAGKTERAHELMETIPPDRRAQAAKRLLEAVRSDADGFADPSSAGLLELLLEYAPDDVDALYRSGMAEIAGGDAKTAERRLRRFLDLAGAADPRRSKAIAKLSDLGDKR